LARKLSDVGTREQHLIELLETWEHILEMAQEIPAWRRSAVTAVDIDQLLTNLPGAIEELKAAMHKMPDYREAFYYEEIKQAAIESNLYGKSRAPRKVHFLQPVAQNCPLDGHSHRPNEICRGCQDLSGWKPPLEPLDDSDRGGA